MIPILRRFFIWIIFKKKKNTTISSEVTGALYVMIMMQHTAL